MTRMNPERIATIRQQCVEGGVVTELCDALEAAQADKHRLADEVAQWILWQQAACEERDAAREENIELRQKDEVQSQLNGQLSWENRRLASQVTGLTEQCTRLLFLLDRENGWLDWAERYRGGDEKLDQEDYYSLRDTTAVWAKEARDVLARLASLTEQTPPECETCGGTGRIETCAVSEFVEHGTSMPCPVCSVEPTEEPQ